MRAVVDTNVLVASALFSNSVPRSALDFLRSAHELIFSIGTFAEFDETVLRPKFDSYIPITERIEFIAMLYRAAHWVEPTETIRVCRDPRDDKFLEAAVAGNAAYLVTGDKDLLTLDPFRQIRILRPAALLAATNR